MICMVDKIIIVLSIFGVVFTMLTENLLFMLGFGLVGIIDLLIVIMNILLVGIEDTSEGEK